LSSARFPREQFMFSVFLPDEVEWRLLADVPPVSLGRAARVSHVWNVRICEHIVDLGRTHGFRLITGVSPVRLLHAALRPLHEWRSPRMRAVPLDASPTNRAVGLVRCGVGPSKNVAVATEGAVYLRSARDTLSYAWSAPAHVRVTHVAYAGGRLVVICTPRASMGRSEWWSLLPDTYSVECVRSLLPPVHGVVGTTKRIFCASSECVFTWTPRADEAHPEVVLRTDEPIVALIRCDWCIGALHASGASWLRSGAPDAGESPSRLEGPTSCVACVHDAFVVGDFLGALHVFTEPVVAPVVANTTMTQARRMRCDMGEAVLAVDISRTLLVGAGLSSLRLWTREGALVGTISRHTGVGVVLVADDGLTLCELSDRLRVWRPATDVWSTVEEEGRAPEGEAM
jgi:hypothetical protein